MTRAALVTGASRGIGRAVCVRLARDGYEIIAVARNAEDLESLRAEIVGAGGACRVVPLDLTDASATSAALEGIDVEVLVNNAGMGVLKSFDQLAPGEWKQMIDLNVNALYHVTRAVLPSMFARGFGQVCTIGSIAGRGAFVGGSCYAATKAFVTAWSESMMLELRDRGVKVSVVMPGAVTTEFNGNEPSAKDAWKLVSEDVAEVVSQVVGAPANVLLHRVEVRTQQSPPKQH